MSIIIGITGPTGAGKSIAVAEALKIGINVIDCDVLARQAVVVGCEGLGALVCVFGNEILNTDGSLNRKKLASIAFSSKEKTELLNETLFPHIIKLVRENIIGDRVILDAPTLFESGLDGICDDTVAVLSDSELRLSRIMERDSLSYEEARLRMSAGKADEYYLSRAGHILYNNSEPESFKKQALELFINIFGGN